MVFHVLELQSLSKKISNIKMFDAGRDLIRPVFIEMFFLSS